MPQTTRTALPETPRLVDDKAGIVRARVSTLLNLADPRDLDLWRVGPVTAADVLNFADLPEGGICPAHKDQPRDPEPLGRPACRACEVGRVAWFIRTGVDNPDDPHPLTLDAGFGLYVPDWPFTDGNHRLMAAAITDTQFLTVALTGDWNRGVALLVDESDPDWVYQNL